MSKRPQHNLQIQKQLTKPISLYSNLYKLQLNNGKLEQYELQFDPEINVDSRITQNHIFKTIIQDVKKDFGKLYVQRSGIFYSLTKQSSLKAYTTNYKGQEYTIHFYHTKTINVDSYADVEGHGNVLTQALNILIKQTLKDMKMLEIGRNSKFYDKKNMEQFQIQGYPLNVWRGISTSSVLGKNGMYMELDFSSRVLRKETALEYINSGATIEGYSVMSTYGNHRVYRIDEVCYNMKPSHTFVYGKTGANITYAKYMQQQYGLTNIDMNQPLLKSIYVPSKNKEEIKIFYLIPQFMRMTGLTDAQVRDGRLMRALADGTKLSPQERVEYISKQAENMAGYLNQNQLSIKDQQSEQLKGFQLKPPIIQLRNKQIQPQKGGFDLQQNIVLDAGHFKNWVIIYERRSQRDDDDCDAIVQDMQKEAQKYGIKVDEPVGYLTVENSNPKNWVQQLEQDIGINGEPAFVVSIMTSKTGNIYPALKEVLYKKYGVIHQNIVKSSLSKHRGSVIAKILLQINAKLGKPLWQVQRPQEVSNKTMIIGLDKYNKSLPGKSACFGFVATCSGELNKFYSRVSIQKQGDQFCNNLQVLYKDAIEFYKKSNNFLPDTIIVYRDGGSEGELSSQVEREVEALKLGVGEFYNKDKVAKPGLAYIIVNKKTSTRMFTEEYDQKSHKNVKSNPPSGTVFDEEGFSSSFNFRLTAQLVRSGTSTPTHYYVGFNSTKWCQETFWLLTYYQCFNYFNWSGAVKVPAPVQYAHKLSYLVGETFKSDPHSELDDSLYYL